MFRAFFVIFISLYALSRPLYATEQAPLKLQDRQPGHSTPLTIQDTDSSPTPLININTNASQMTEEQVLAWFLSPSDSLNASLKRLLSVMDDLEQAYPNNPNPDQFESFFKVYLHAQDLRAQKEEESQAWYEKALAYEALFDAVRELESDSMQQGAPILEAAYYYNLASLAGHKIAGGARNRALGKHYYLESYIDFCEAGREGDNPQRMTLITRSIENRKRSSNLHYEYSGEQKKDSEPTKRGMSKFHESFIGVYNRILEAHRFAKPEDETLDNLVRKFLLDDPKRTYGEGLNTKGVTLSDFKKSLKQKLRLERLMQYLRHQDLSGLLAIMEWVYLDESDPYHLSSEDMNILFREWLASQAHEEEITEGDGKALFESGVVYITFAKLFPRTNELEWIHAKGCDLIREAADRGFQPAVLYSYELSSRFHYYAMSSYDTALDPSQRHQRTINLFKYGFLLKCASSLGNRISKAALSSSLKGKLRDTDKVAISKSDQMDRDPLLSIYDSALSQHAKVLKSSKGQALFLPVSKSGIWRQIIGGIQQELKTVPSDLFDHLGLATKHLVNLDSLLAIVKAYKQGKINEREFEILYKEWVSLCTKVGDLKDVETHGVLAHFREAIHESRKDKTLQHSFHLDNALIHHAHHVLGIGRPTRAAVRVAGNYSFASGMDQYNKGLDILKRAENVRNQQEKNKRIRAAGEELVSAFEQLLIAESLENQDAKDFLHKMDQQVDAENKKKSSPTRSALAKAREKSVSKFILSKIFLEKGRTSEFELSTNWRDCDLLKFEQILEELIAEEADNKVDPELAQLIKLHSSRVEESGDIHSLPVLYRQALLANLSWEEFRRLFNHAAKYHKHSDTRESWYFSGLAFMVLQDNEEKGDTYLASAAFHFNVLDAHTKFKFVKPDFDIVIMAWYKAKLADLFTQATLCIEGKEYTVRPDPVETLWMLNMSPLLFPDFVKDGSYKKVYSLLQTPSGKLAAAAKQWQKDYTNEVAKKAKAAAEKFAEILKGKKNNLTLEKRLEYIWDAWLYNECPTAFRNLIVILYGSWVI